MKNSLRKVMSLALTVVMLFSLLLPVTGVMATELPSLEMTVVDENGTALTQLYPNAKAYLRISLKNVTAFKQTTFDINLENMEFDGGTSCVITEAWKTSSNAATLADFKFNEAGNGFTSATNLNALFAAGLTAAVQEVTLNGDVVPVVDIPVKVTGALGSEAKATFDIEKDTYIELTSGDQKWVTGDAADEAAAINFAMSITAKPYKIASLALKNAITISKTTADVDVAALFTTDNEVIATMTEDRDEDGNMDTRTYKIYTTAPTGDGADTKYALVTESAIDLVDCNADASTVFNVPINIVDDTITTDSLKIFDAKVTITASKKTDTIKVDSDKTVDVKYGATAAEIQAAVAARTDLFKAKYEDGTYAPDTVTITAANVTVGEAVDTEKVGAQKVTVTAPDGKTIEADGAEVTINVKPTTITGIAFSVPVAEQPQGKADDKFPSAMLAGLGAKIKATLDSTTSNIAEKEYDIEYVDALPEAHSSNTAYVVTSSYKADTIGTYNLPVTIVASNIGGAFYTYTGAVSMKVGDPKPTGVIVLDEDAYLRIDYTDDEATAKTNAVAAVEAAKASLFFDKLTNGEISTDYSKAVITVSGVDKAVLDADNNVVKVGVSTNEGENNFINEGDFGILSGYVRVHLGEPPAITAAKFVDKDGKDVTPSIIAAIANDNMTEEHYPSTMDWSKYKVVATYENPNPNDTANPTLTETYTFGKDGGNKTFLVTDWQDYKDCEKVGDQNVTVVITDSAKKDGGKSFTLKATITEAVTFGLTRVKKDATVSIKNGKDEEFAKKAILDADDLFEAFYTDNTWKAVKVKADGCDIDEELTDYTAAGDYEFKVGFVAGRLEYIGDGMNDVGTLTIKKKSSGGSSAGTVVGGGGVVSGTKKDEPADEPADEPTTPAEPTEPADPNAPAEPTEPAEPTNPSAPAEEPGAAPDVPKSHWANDIIAKLIERGIISGDSAGNINPDNLISREEAAKIMAMAGGFDMDADLDGITDAASISDWAKAYVAAALKAGAFTGYADGSFGGKDMVTREQFAAIVIRAFGFGEGTGDLTFTDADTIGWSKAFIAKAAELGIVTGYSDGSFRPTATITRAEAFAMVNRALQLKEALDAVVNDEADVADDTADVADDTADVADDTADVADEADEVETADDEADVADDAADVDDTADVADVADETADVADEAEEADDADEAEDAE